MRVKACTRYQSAAFLFCIMDVDHIIEANTIRKYIRNFMTRPNSSVLQDNNQILNPEIGHYNNIAFR